MTNVYDSAYELEKTIRESEEYKSLKKAYENVMNDESAKKMYEDFRDSQLSLQEKQMKGEDISEEEVEKARKLFELIQQHKAISNLLEQEQRLNVIITDISQIISKPLDELYGKEG